MRMISGTVYRFEAETERDQADGFEQGLIAAEALYIKELKDKYIRFYVRNVEES